MIKVVAKNFIKEGKSEEFAAVARQLVSDTNALEAECISYELYRDVKNPNVYTFIEEWQSKDSLKKHMATKHFQEASARFAVLLEQPGDITIYTKA